MTIAEACELWPRPWWCTPVSFGRPGQAPLETYHEIASPKHQGALGLSSLTGLPACLHRHLVSVLLLEAWQTLPQGSKATSVRATAPTMVPGGKLMLSTPAAGSSALPDPIWHFVGHLHYGRKTFVGLLGSKRLAVSRDQHSGQIWTSIDTLLLYLLGAAPVRRHASGRGRGGVLGRAARPRRYTQASPSTQALSPRPILTTFHGRCTDSDRPVRATTPGRPVNVASGAAVLRATPSLAVSGESVGFWRYRSPMLGW